MKKLIFLFALIVSCFALKAQNGANVNGAVIVSKPQIFQKWISIAPYTTATLPAAASCPRCEVFNSDSLTLAVSNGTVWTYPLKGNGGSGTWGAITGNILSQSDLQNLFARDFKYSDTSTVIPKYLIGVLRHSDSVNLLSGYALSTNTVKYADSTAGGVLTEFVKNINYNPATIGLGNVLNRKQVINLGGIDSVEVLNFTGGTGFPTAANGPSLVYAPDSNALYYNNKSAYTKISGGSNGGTGGDDSVHMASRFYVQSTFVPLSIFNQAGIEAALTFTPYNAINPNGYINANQVITVIPSGDIKGKASGATAINPVDTVTGLLTEPLPALAKGVLTNNGAGAWALAPLNIADSTYTVGGLAVSRGGTGVTSFQPFALVFGGTAAQGGLQQNAANYFGMAGQALLSAGAGALATWGKVWLPADTTGIIATQFFVNNKHYISGNQSIALTFGGTDVSGSGSGTTAIGFNPQVIGIRGVSIPTLTNGFLTQNGGAWVFDNSTYVTPVILSDSLNAADTIHIIYPGSTGVGAIYGQSTAALYSRLIVNGQGNADSSMDVFNSTRVVHQTAHGFIVGEPVSYGAGTFIAADTNNPALAVVSRVVDANDFEINLGGWMPWTSNGLTANNYYYVNEPAGTLSLTSPNKSQPVLYAIDGNNVVVNIMRPHNFNGGSGVLTSIPPLDSVLAHGSTSGRAMSVGAFSALSASVSGAVNLTGLNDVLDAGGQVVEVDSVTGLLTRHPAQFINMAISNRNGYVATYDSVNQIFYLGPGGSGGSALTMGSLDGQTANANAGAIVGGQFFQQSASGLLPGVLQAGSSQTLGGIKIWTGSTQEWTGTTIEMPNLPDWVSANYLHYNVVLQDSTVAGKLNIAPAEYINMNGASNGWIPFWNSAANQFQLEQIPVTGIGAGNGGLLFTTSLSTGQVPSITFNITPSSPWTLYGNNTASSAGGTFFSPSLTSALFANQGTTTTVLHGNVAGNPSFAAVNLGSDITATLSPLHGGTGLAGYSVGDMITSAVANTLVALSGNTTTVKEFLTSTGTGSAATIPVWGSLGNSDISTALGFNPENIANKLQTVNSSASAYPSNAAVTNYVTGNFFPLVGGTLSGVAGTGFIGFKTQSQIPTTPPVGTEYIFATSSNAISFLGSNGFYSTFNLANSANRTYTFPDLTGGVITDNAVQTLTNKTLTSPNFNFGSDQAGDMMTRTGSGVYTNLAAGPVGSILQILSANTPGYGNVLSSSTFVPTLAGVLNVSSITLTQATYSRNGNIVTFLVSGSITPTSANTITTWTISLPFTTATTTQTGVASGSMSVNSGTATAAIFGGITSSSTLGSVVCDPSSTSGDNFTVIFQYTL